MKRMDEQNVLKAKQYGFEVYIMNSASDEEAMSLLKAEARKFFGSFLVDIGAVAYHPPMDRTEMWSPWGAKVRLVMPDEKDV